MVAPSSDSTPITDVEIDLDKAQAALEAGEADEMPVEEEVKLPAGVMNESQTYRELAKQYGKFIRGGNRDRAQSIDYLDTSLSRLSVGSRYKAILTEKGKERIEGTQNFKTVERSEVVEGHLIGFSSKGGHINVVLEGEQQQMHHIPIDPSAYVDYFSQLDHSTSESQIIFSKNSDEKLRLLKE